MARGANLRPVRALELNVGTERRSLNRHAQGMNSMRTDTNTNVSAVEIQEELRQLYVERALAELEGLASDPGYMTDLLDDIESHKSAFVGAVVTEIATLRSELGGMLRG
jgi:hypothetical protein